MNKKNLCVLVSSCILLAGALMALPASAHQPQVPGDATNIDVPDPTVSKAYYAELKGQPVTYHLEATAPFTLYLNVLVPKIADVTEDYTLTVTKDGQPWTVLTPGTAPWNVFHEPFGGDTYWMGPEYKADVQPGDYEVTVSSPDNRGKYVLAIGELESFPASEILRTMKTLVEVKHYFGKPSIAIFQSPFIYGPTIGLVIIVGGVWWLIAWRRRRGARHSGPPNPPPHLPSTSSGQVRRGVCEKT
ncbi:MAG: hypothetical protein V1685_03100 [Parcubacteria group bacterium]